jgi:hypothetical protein
MLYFDGNIDCSVILPFYVKSGDLGMVLSVHSVPFLHVFFKFPSLWVAIGLIIRFKLI